MTREGKEKNHWSQSKLESVYSIIHYSFATSVSEIEIVRVR